MKEKKYSILTQFKRNYLLGEVLSKTSNLITYIVTSMKGTSLNATANIVGASGALPFVLGVGYNGIQQGIKEGDNFKEKLSNVTKNLISRYASTQFIGVGIDFLYRREFNKVALQLSDNLTQDGSLEEKILTGGMILSANILADIPYYSMVLPLERLFNKIIKK